MSFHRFIGISVAGGKTNKTCLAVLDYFVSHKKLFLTQIVDRIGAENQQSADAQLLEKLKLYEENLKLVAIDAPLSLPICMTCKLRCPGVDSCKVNEVVWMKNEHKLRKKTKKPNLSFTPYTERAIEIFLNSKLEEPFAVSHALGANAAPLTARAHFLKKHIKAETIEVMPKLSLWRVGRNLKIAKSHLRFHRHASTGNTSREVILTALAEKKIMFMYEADQKQMIQSNSCFEAFFSALTAFLSFNDQCEERPKDFPKKSAWISFPRGE